MPVGLFVCSLASCFASYSRNNLFVDRLLHHWYLTTRLLLKTKATRHIQRTMHSLTDFAICNRLQKDCIIYFSREGGEGRRETEYFHTHKRLEVIKQYRLCSIAQVAGSPHLPLSCMNLINLFATVDIFFHTVSSICPFTCFYVHSPCSIYCTTFLFALNFFVCLLGTCLCVPVLTQTLTLT